MTEQKLHVLMISTDRNIFREGSDANMRMKAYATLVKELHIIVFAKRSLGFSEISLAPNARAYPTNSRSRFFYMSNAYALARRLFAPGAESGDLTFSQPGIDLVTAQDPFETGFAGYRISRLLGRPLEFQVHTDVFNPAFRRSSVLNFIRVFVARFLLRSKATIRVVSERLRDSILHNVKYGFNRAPRITVLPVFVDAEKFRITPASFGLHEKYPGFDLLVLAVARLEKEKNVLGALCIMEEVRRARPDLYVGLVVVGSGSQENMLKKYAKRAGIGDRVFFCGWQSDMVSYYKTADVLLVTSEYEGYPLMFVEAAASGCPVLTRDVGGARDTFSSRNAVICPDGDEGCLGRNIINLASNSALREAFLSSARGEANRITFRTKEEYLAAYKRMWEEAVRGDDFLPLI